MAFPHSIEHMSLKYFKFIIHISSDLSLLQPPPHHSSGCILFAPPDALVKYFSNELLCNDTCALKRGGGGGGVHNVFGDSVCGTNRNDPLLFLKKIRQREQCNKFFAGRIFRVTTYNVDWGLLNHCSNRYAHINNHESFCKKTFWGKNFVLMIWAFLFHVNLNAPRNWSIVDAIEKSSDDSEATVAMKEWRKKID